MVEGEAEGVVALAIHFDSHHCAGVVDAEPQSSSIAVQEGNGIALEKITERGGARGLSSLELFLFVFENGQNGVFHQELGHSREFSGRNYASEVGGSDSDGDRSRGWGRGSAPNLGPGVEAFWVISGRCMGFVGVAGEYDKVHTHNGGDD